MRNIIASIVMLSTLGACSFMARGEDQYRSDTRELLETKNADVKACYDRALATNPAQSGSVVVNFTVEKKTGTITNVAADPDQSSAPENLQACVVSAIDGLQLTPEDRRDGEATFTWVFKGGA